LVNHGLTCFAITSELACAIGLGGPACYSD
jgi:hypothetical protein